MRNFIRIDVQEDEHVVEREYFAVLFPDKIAQSMFKPFRDESGEEVRDHFRKCAIDVYDPRTYQVIVPRLFICGRVAIANADDCERVRRQNLAVDVVMDNMIAVVEFAQCFYLLPVKQLLGVVDDDAHWSVNTFKS